MKYVIEWFVLIWSKSNFQTIGYISVLEMSSHGCFTGALGCCLEIGYVWSSFIES